jgi:hypothetical protein
VGEKIKSKLKLTRFNPHPQHTRTAHLGPRRRPTTRIPAPRQHVICDFFHGVQGFWLVGDEGGVSEDDGGAVVAGVVEGGEGEDEAV